MRYRTLTEGATFLTFPNFPQVGDPRSAESGFKKEDVKITG
jgi:hypothetical protein